MPIPIPPTDPTNEAVKLLEDVLDRLDGIRSAASGPVKAELDTVDSCIESAVVMLTMDPVIDG